MKLLKNSVIYTGVSVFENIIKIALIPLYTYFLTPTEYGVVTLITSLIGILTPIYMLSLRSSATRYYYEYKEDNQTVKDLFGSTYIFVLINSLILSSVLWFFGEPLFNVFLKGVPFYPFVMIGIITAFFNTLFLLYQSISQAKQDGKEFATNQFFLSLTNVILSTFFIIGLDLGALGAVLGSLVTFAIFSVYTLVKIIPKITLGINKKLLKLSLSYSLPLVPHDLSLWIMLAVNQFFLNAFQTTASVGIYSIGFFFSSIISIISVSINRAYVPWFFENIKNKRSSDNTILFTEYVLLFYCIIALCLALFSKEVIYLFLPQDYAESWKVVPIISFAYVANAIYFFFVNLLLIDKKSTKIISMCTLSSALFNIILNIILIPHYGIIGSATATLLAYLAKSVTVAFFAIRTVSVINLNWKKMYSLFSILFIISLISYYPSSDFSTTLLLGKIAIVVFLCYTIFQLNRKQTMHVVNTLRKNFYKR